jgi:hypothetical protein
MENLKIEYMKKVKCETSLVNDGKKVKKIMGMQVSLLHIAIHSFEYMHRSDAAGSYGRSMLRFSRDLHTGFHSDCTSLHSHPESLGVHQLMNG